MHHHQTSSQSAIIVAPLLSIQKPSFLSRPQLAPLGKCVSFLIMYIKQKKSRRNSILYNIFFAVM